MRQVDIMMEGEADAMFRRQEHELGLVDRVTDVIAEMKLRPETMLEVGCSNGWRLSKFKDMFGSNCLGIDPSNLAVQHGKAHGLSVRRGSADQLPTLSHWADMIIYGFCLYLTDPPDWFRIASEGDRVLKPNGYMVVHDFAEEGGLLEVSYKHDKRLVSYHFDFTKLWLVHPRYVLIRRRMFDQEMVTILKKLA